MSSSLVVDIHVANTAILSPFLGGLVYVTFVNGAWVGNTDVNNQNDTETANSTEKYRGLLWSITRTVTIRIIG